ncbi:MULTISPECIES: hypothetical protein [Burkholderia]|uniref:hypothetical protein n=1 Tax=Burkholderia TaxID=32008 RepID=UPI0011B26C6A|nr:MULTISPECIES: hypothetical protein [Burkholderia]MCA8065183.1 hypothetical protein [Burkholderia sp. AU38729]MCI3972624.1 hypothetical protein [Burkholderia sp. HI4860]
MFIRRGPVVRATIGSAHDGKAAGLLRRGILSSMGNDGYLAKGHRFLSVCDLRQFDAHCDVSV